MKVFECFKTIEKIFEEKNIAEAQAQAREIACYFAEIPYGDIFLRKDTPVKDGWQKAARERISGKPVAYILKTRNFYGYDFYVDENVLIPRFDTECVVEKAIEEIKKNSYKKILDMCCGSGCIGVTINKETVANVVCADISEKAVEITKKNAAANGCENFSAVRTDLFENITGKFDLIISNPPYVTNEEYEGLESHVKDFEPKSALLGGLEFYKKIAAQAKDFLNEKASLVFEIGETQGEEVSQILKKEGYNNIFCGKDLCGKDRVIICTIN